MKLSKKTEYYENGHLKETYFSDENNRKQGLYRKYWPNGRLWIKCTYQDGKLNGRYQSYYRNGQLLSECNYTNGKEDGTYLSQRSIVGKMCLQDGAEIIYSKKTKTQQNGKKRNLSQSKNKGLES